MIKFLSKPCLSACVAAVVTAGALVFSVVPNCGAQNVDDDQHFLSLREAASKEDTARVAALAAQLANYSLASYVDYYQLKAHLRTAQPTEINDFLTRQSGTILADRLRHDWLLMLGWQNNWVNFDLQYAQLLANDDVQLKCFSLLSQFAQGQNVAAAARNLLTSGKVYGEGCFPLFTNLVQSGQFSQTDMWNQLRWASETNSMGVAVKLAMLANLTNVAKVLELSNMKTAASAGSDLPKALTKILAKPLEKSVEAHQTALILLGRVAKVDLDHALSLLAKWSPKFDASERALAWAQIALPAAQKLAPEALEYWSKTAGAELSPDAYQWRVRSALRNTDWVAVKSAIEAMPASMQSDPAWVYWLGRAYIAQNQPELAQPFFMSIASQPNFYGQLAMEELGLRTSIPLSTPVLPLEVSFIANNPGIQRALKLYALNLRTEASREWNWQLRTMTEQQLLAAAEFARENNLLDRMVNTSDRTKTLFDFTQRFPSPYLDIMTKSTTALGLDMAWVYGVIRQESRFILNARSSVGAAGLMQVMPGTVKYVIKKMNYTELDLTKVNEFETNIVLGTSYLNIILGNLNGSQLLASAGYNAGPNRALAWRANLPKAVEGAIFTETIPFTETRDYVKNVMSNTTYYSALFTHSPQSLKQRLGTVAPNEAEPIN